jgi:hypothetical protein
MVTMTSEALVERLAADCAPVRRRAAGRDALWLAIVGIGELLLFLLGGAMRPDIAHAMTLPVFWWRLASFGALGLVGSFAAIRALRPGASSRVGLGGVAGTAAAALLAGWAIDGLHVQAQPIAERLLWQQGLLCLAMQLLLAVPPFAALALLMRRGAATDVRAASLVAGGTAAAWGAVVFLLHCPHDDPLYVVVWYGAGCLVAALAGRWLLPAIIRW